MLTPLALTVADTVARLTDLPFRELDMHLVDVVVCLPPVDPHSAEIALDLVAGPVNAFWAEETGTGKVPEIRPVAGPWRVIPRPRPLAEKWTPLEGEFTSIDVGELRQYRARSWWCYRLRKLAYPGHDRRLRDLRHDDLTAGSGKNMGTVVYTQRSTHGSRKKKSLQKLSATSTQK